MSLKSIVKKLIPPFFVRYYHLFLAVLANLVYGFPSRKMIIIGVTGTNGKTTTCSMIARILEDAGYRVGMMTTINFKIGQKEWVNTTKQGMQGRFKLQRMLNRMLKAGCSYAVIESTSQGIDQFRSFGIAYDICVFTNLTPEHLEAHGGFENYKKAKLKLFRQLENRKDKIINGKKIAKVIVANFDDNNVLSFIDFKVDRILGVRVSGQREVDLEKFINDEKFKFFIAENIDLGFQNTKFNINGYKINLNLTGLFNIYNSLEALSVATFLDVDFEVIKESLERIQNVPGRMQFVENTKGIVGIVDYAHDPNSIKGVYENIKNIKKPEQKIIAVLGSCGGGRDADTRVDKGRNVGELCDFVIVTNEDPYDDDPEKIINDVFCGVLLNSKMVENQNCFRILDRKQAIEKAVNLASEGDIIVCTGKGAERCIMGKNGQRQDWDEYEILKNTIENKK